jgi:alanine racemase
VVGSPEIDPRTRAWAEVDLTALVRNYRWLEARAGGRKLIAVVKADGYGHGAVPVARALRGAGAELLAVATLDEARALRAAGERGALLLLGPLLTRAEVDLALALELAVAATRIEVLELLAQAAAASGRFLPVHLKLDTGMARLGLSLAELDAALARLRSSSHLRLDGVMSHLAEADDASSPRTREQRERLGAALASIRAAGHEPAWIHVDNSAGIVRGCWPQASAARPGIALYGGAPTRERGEPLEPVMSLFARVCHAKDVPAGARVGYGGTWVASEPARVLTLALGYADGFPRAAGSHRIGLRGARLPLAGRVSCDLICAVAARGSRGEVGQAALIFGRDGELRVPVDELADAAGTISYEILTRIGPRVPRIHSH